MTINYRPEIDGLRSIAVLPVILFHAGVTIFSGGYVGVDVFFVISGYLITLMIIAETEVKNFSLIQFYERRIRRIIPALFFVILVCLPFAWFMMMPYELRDFSQSLVAVVFFASNILFWKESNYFEPDSEQKPLLHTWSLAVEEQFYIFFPLLIIVFWRFGKQKTLLLLILLASVSLVFSDFQSRTDPEANFYLTPSRIWELLFGSIVAVYIKDKGPIKNNLLSLMGLILIGFSIIFFDDDTRFPSFLTLVPVVGTCMIIVYSHKETFTGRILSSSAPVQIGLISYSAYLFHQPIFAFARINSFEHPSTPLMIFLALLSLVLAFFSWKYIEAPFRNKKKFSKRTIFSLFTFFSVFILVIGLSGHFSNGFYDLKTSGIKPENRLFLFDRNDKYSERNQYWKSNLQDSQRDFTDLSTKKILILGDSVGKDFYISAISSTSLAEEYQFRYVDFDDECMNINAMSQKQNFNCANMYNFLTKSKLLDDADIVILSAHWGKRSWKNPLVMAEALPAQTEIRIIGSFKVAETSSIAMHSAQNGYRFDEMSRFAYKTLSEDYAYSERISEEISEISRITYFDKLEIFCNKLEEKCEFFDKKYGYPFIWDNMHITLEGRELFARWIQKEVLK